MTPARRGGTVLAALACALLGACAQSATAPGTRTTHGSAARSTSGRTTGLHWAACDGIFQCARLSVPISYADAAAGSLGIAVVKLPANDPSARLGAIVINPGGPGGSGIQFLEDSYQVFPSSLRARFDLVSFDPRGVGESDPVNCVSAAGMRAYVAVDPAPGTATQVSRVVSATKSFVASCEANTSHLLLANVGTVDAARDMDRLRAALGEGKLDYLGFSYGSYLGAVYANLFPTHIRAMVLDGAVDPSLGVAVEEEQQGAGFETDLHDFFSWCDTTSSCHSGLRSGAEAEFNSLFNQFAGGQTVTAYLTAPLGGTQQIGYGVALTGVVAALYSRQYWPQLGDALAQAKNGDGSALAAAAYSYAGIQQDGSLQNLMAANVAISCVDRPSPTGLGTLETLARQFAADEPTFGAAEAWSSLACDYWPVPTTGTVGPIHADGTPPIVVVGSTQDPATPYSWAQALASQLQHGVLLTRTGVGHTGYLFSSCVRTDVDAYFMTLATPRRGTVCPS